MDSPDSPNQPSQAPAAMAETHRYIFEQASGSAYHLSLALLDASIRILIAQDPASLPAARQIAAIAAKAATVAARIPDCVPRAGAGDGEAT